MNYRVYKLDFQSGVHFGKNTLDNTEYTFSADTLFSALCQEAVKENQDKLDELVKIVKSGQLLLSDAFPYMGDEYFLPKPMLPIENKKNQGDSSIKKAYKKMQYIPVSQFDTYLKGELSVEHTKKLRKLGKKMIKVSASVRGMEETVPYRIGVYYFGQGNGLYFIAGYEQETAIALLEDLMESLMYSGLGGKRSSGLGRFEYKYAKKAEGLLAYLQKDNGENSYMTLSVALPQEEELESVIQGSSYLLKKRSGFVASENYAKEQVRKKDLYVFQAGSCFHGRFSGDIYDVSVQGTHPVYRYAKPMFMEV